MKATTLQYPASTSKPRRLAVSLVYQQQPRELGKPPQQSAGIGPDVKHNITEVSDDHAILQLHGIDGK